MRHRHRRHRRFNIIHNRHRDQAALKIMQPLVCGPLRTCTVPDRQTQRSSAISLIVTKRRANDVHTLFSTVQSFIFFSFIFNIII